jgi:hypothetical protein
MKPIGVKMIVDVIRLSLSLTDWLELSPSREAASCSPTQKFHNVLCNPNINYRIHKEHSTGTYSEPGKSKSY